MLYKVQELHQRQVHLLSQSIEKGKHKEYVNITRDGKTFTQLREVGSNKVQSAGLQHLEMIEKMTSGNQQKFFQWQLSNAKMCTIEPSGKGIVKGNLQVKQCYKNASDVALLNSDVMYVEGFIMFHGIPIEHAWNKEGDKYFDVTQEGPLSKYKPSEEYISLIELNKDEMYEYMMKTQMHGPFMNEYYRDLKDKS